MVTIMKARMGFGLFVVALGFAMSALPQAQAHAEDLDRVAAPSPAVALATWNEVTRGHGSTYSGHRDRLDRTGLLRAIARAREAKVITEDHAGTLVALVELVGSQWR